MKHDVFLYSQRLQYMQYIQSTTFFIKITFSLKLWWYMSRVLNGKVMISEIIHQKLKKT